MDFLEGSTPKSQELILEKNSTPNFKVFSVRDKEKANADLLRLIISEEIQAIKEKKNFISNKELHLEEGDIKLKIDYRSEYSDLYIITTETEISGSSMRIKLDEIGKPKEVILIDDYNNFFATIFSEAGFNTFKDLGVSNKKSLQAFIAKEKRIKKIDYFLETLRLDSDRVKRIDQIYRGKDGFFVVQDFYRIDKLDTPMSTTGLNTCSALVVIDKEKKLHYLAHISAAVPEEKISRSLDSFDLSNCEIYIMEGPYPSSAVKNIIGSIIDSPEILNNIKFIEVSKSGIFQGLTSQNGELYFEPSNLKDWKKEASSFQFLGKTFER